MFCLNISNAHFFFLIVYDIEYLLFIPFQGRIAHVTVTFSFRDGEQRTEISFSQTFQIQCCDL